MPKSPFGVDGYRPGDYYAICDVCGFKHRASAMRLRWDNAFVCSKDWEIKHPQEKIRGITDRITPRGEIRSEPADTFKTVEITQDDL